MKNPTNKILTLILVGLFAFNQKTYSQENFGEIFRAGPADANTYIQKYSEAIGLSFNSGLGSGWYNTAKPHKLLGFDLTATLNVAAIPDEDIRFQFNQSDYDVLELESGNGSLPSLVGGSSDNNFLVVPAGTIIQGDNGPITYQNDKVFAAPDGIIDANDYPAVGTPVPAFQLGIGLMKNTDLKIRYASDLGSIEDGSVRLIGFGVLHDLKQWIPGLKQVPVDVSGFFGYTSLKVEYNFEESGDGYEVSNGLAELKANSTTVQIVASKQLAILTPYVGVGYNIAGSSFKVNGLFEYQEGLQTAEIVDPVDLKFTGGSTPRINAGLRVKLLVLTLHAEYAIQKYNTFTLGAGISIR
ncbi:DUF6588 family protein [Ekhidna sp.]|uniref:DUF6588 family protein n=1 Tax=Ekhidna sp. TaxID=2608089 RepID=UPI0035134509